MLYMELYFNMYSFLLQYYVIYDLVNQDRTVHVSHNRQSKLFT